MELTILESSEAGLRVGYTCPCGCTPSVAYERGTDAVAEGCCCGNHFVVGPQARSSLTPTEGFRLEATPFQAPWGQGLEAAWLVGPSVHASESDHRHDQAGDHDHHDEDAAASAIDPVCGMTVEPDAARARGLHSAFEGRDFYFCGKGCKLEFDDDPQKYLDPSYVPSM